MRDHSRWPMPIPRVAMGLFLAAWGVDKLVATEGSIGRFSHFYGLDAGAAALQLFGAAAG